VCIFATARPSRRVAINIALCGPALKGHTAPSTLVPFAETADRDASSTMSFGLVSNGDIGDL
jgi:hypothetical protein